MSKATEIAVLAGVIALVIARFALTANDSFDTILVPASAAASPLIACPLESERSEHAHGPRCAWQR